MSKYKLAHAASFNDIGCKVFFPNGKKLNVFCQPWAYLMNVLFMLFVFIYAYWCLTLFPYHMIFALFRGNQKM
jgi:hypothetical protein